MCSPWKWFWKRLVELPAGLDTRNGLENRFGRLRPTRVQIPPPPLDQAETRTARRVSASQRLATRSPPATAQDRWTLARTGAKLARTSRRPGRHATAASWLLPPS